MVRLLRGPAAVVGLFFFAWWSPPALAQADFPIGYSSLGGTYAFISLIEEQKLLEKEGIRPAFVYIGGPQISQALIAGDIRMARGRARSGRRLRAPKCASSAA
jgi:ABC-type nitrate/sulfonate/bicarbonate transport system substrate-binding protein